MSSIDRQPTPTFRPLTQDSRWEGVDLMAYKADGSAPFRDVTRQTLFADPELAAELRYFEVAANGHSTLERHHHVHAVMIYRGRGRCLVGHEVRDVATGDLVYVPPMTWHQFRAGPHAPIGFLCMVNASRDKVQLPTAEDMAALTAVPEIAAFLGWPGPGLRSR